MRRAIATLALGVGAAWLLTSASEARADDLAPAVDKVRPTTPRPAESPKPPEAFALGLLPWFIPPAGLGILFALRWHQRSRSSTSA